MTDRVYDDGVSTEPRLFNFRLNQLEVVEFSGDQLGGKHDITHFVPKEPMAQALLAAKLTEAGLPTRQFPVSHFAIIRETLEQLCLGGLTAPRAGF